MERVFELKRVWQLERGAFVQAIDLLAAATNGKWKIDQVLGIARGGSEPARLLAQRLRLPMLEVSAQHNCTDQVRSTTQVNVTLSVDDQLCSRLLDRVLIVDDICGTGRTLEAVYAMLQRIRPGTEMRSATLCRNAGSKFTPDCWVWTVRDWVIFPWEKGQGPLEVEPLPHPLQVLSLP